MTNVAGLDDVADDLAVSSDDVTLVHDRRQDVRRLDPVLQRKL